MLDHRLSVIREMLELKKAGKEVSIGGMQNVFLEEWIHKALPEAKVASWNGFVFINQDPDAEPLEDFLGTMLNDWERWDYNDRIVYSHFGGIVDCNWKVALEAFAVGQRAGVDVKKLVELISAGPVNRSLRPRIESTGGGVSSCAKR